MLDTLKIFVVSGAILFILGMVAGCAETLTRIEKGKDSLREEVRIEIGREPADWVLYMNSQGGG